MPEITIISGKGGTGKTSITAAFAKLASDHVVCDLDVDAPDLHLLLHPEIAERHIFMAGRTAVIDPDLCGGCGECAARCRFEAIAGGPDGFAVDEHACEGCGVCAHFCPTGAIRMEQSHAGNWYRSSVESGPMIHAELFPGAENSGLLVATLRRVAEEERGTHREVADPGRRTAGHRLPGDRLHLDDRFRRAGHRTDAVGRA